MIGTSAAILAATLASTGASAVSGAMAGRKKTSTSTTTPSFTPGQTKMQDVLAGALESEFNNPKSRLGPAKTATIGKVNQTFKGAGERLETSLAGRGMNQSGAVRTGMADIERGRASAISGVEGQFAQAEQDQHTRLMELMQRYAFATPGQETTATGSGNMVGGAINGGLETSMMLMALNKMLGGGGVIPPNRTLTADNSLARPGEFPG